MLTITNKLETCLVIPEAQRKGALFLEPKGKAKVETICASLKDAERNGHIVIRYPVGENPDGKQNGSKKKKEKRENDSC